MEIEQVRLVTGRWSGPSRLGADWVLAFGATGVVADPATAAELRRRYPAAAVLGCSTAGAIEGARVLDDALVVTAVKFAHARVRVEEVELAETAGALAAGARLAARLAAPDLVHVFVVSEGVQLNGSALIAGIVAGLPGSVTASGGLAADGTRMTTTAVLTSSSAGPGRVAAAGLYGPRLRVGCGSQGGWDPFGPERVITRSDGNVLFELDEQPALELYQRYLGSHAAALPSSGLMFPLAVRDPDGGAPAVTRTLLAIDPARGSITFAGDMPVGHVARLMHASVDRLVDGATGAAQACGAGRAGLALVVSCAGRRIMMGQRAEEELEAVAEVLGPVPTTGFYANGELGPVGAAPTTLHNQTMTITTLREV